jgi:hypothetical protein
MNKNKSPIIYFFILLPFIIAAYWSLIPYQKINKTLIYDHSPSTTSPLEDCRLFSELLEKEFTLEYPEKIRLLDKDTISLSLKSAQGSSLISENSNGENSCSVGVEAEIRNIYLDLKPGGNISSPFIGYSFQQLNWQIYAGQTKDSESIIWIYALVNQFKEEPMQRIPLFAVPLEISVVHLWGISPLYIRYLSIGIILLLIITISRKSLIHRML